MEGYSVTEAASVLGVPTERIWELLARGVLAGAPEGDTGMRVFLQPRPAPAPSEPRGPNGHGGDPEREMSPFRELLTEFRNLTERYGQALLALGESRGEVAALRSRVDLLEARMDLRLPGGSSWTPSPPFPAEHAVIPTMPEPAADSPSPAPGSELAEEQPEEEIRRRARGPRRATESFAEALARADDPSPPELPETLESRARDLEDATLPRAVPAAEAVLVADEAEEVEEPGSGAPPEAAEPDAIDDVHEAATPEPEPEPMFGEEVEPPASEETPVTFASDDLPLAAAAEPPAVELDATPTIDDVPVEAWMDEDVTPPGVADAEPAATVESADHSDVAGWDDTDAVEATREPDPHVEANAEPIADEDPAEAPEAEVEREEVPEPLEWDAERYTTTIDEPDWFEAEVDDSPMPAREPDASARTIEEPVTEATVEPAPEAVMVEEPAPVTTVPDEVVPPPTVERPAETSSVADEPRPLPGSAELDRALEALRRRAIEADEEVEWPPSAPDGEADAVTNEMTAPPFRPSLPTRTRTPPVTPAGRAYRRLRRIFPG